MNRELKFRCWDKINKKFVPPSHIAINGNGILLVTDSGMYEKLQNRNYCNVDQEYVVQQFTGEYDKNRKEIYEGDIISSYSAEFINENYEAEIVFIDAGFHAKVNEKDYRGIWSGDDIEVMGNIFQLPCNPDHNGECLVCDCWLSDCPFNKEKPQDDLQKVVKQDPMWQKPLGIDMTNEQTFLEFKIPYSLVANNVLTVKELFLIKLQSYGYVIKPYILMSEEKFNYILSEAGIEKLEVSFLEDEQNYRFKVFNKAQKDT